MTGALALVATLVVSGQIQTHPTGLKSVGLSHGRGKTRTVQILDKLYEQAGKPSLDLDMARYKDLHDNASGETSLVSFTRSSMGTYVDSDGLIKRSAVNQVLYSEQFDNGYWGKLNTAVQANQIVSPDGKQTADKVREDAASGLHGAVRLGIPLSGNNTWSFYAKAGERTRIALNAYNGISGSFHVFDLASGTIISNPTGTATITDVGNGWYRCTAYRSAGGGSQFSLYLVSSGTTISYSGDGTSGLYIWGAQLEEGTTATPYIRTTSTISGAPRFDHDPVTGESLGLLVEEARTNLLPYSESFDVWPFRPGLNAFGSGSVANATVAPDGQTTADLITETTATTGRLIYQNVPITGTLTWSFYVKSYSGNRFVRFQTHTSSSWFDLENGVWGTVAAGMTPSVTALPNGWYRITLTGNPAGNRYAGVGPAPADGISSYTGDGTSGFYVWGAQVEAGAFPTSYIPTEGSTVTRAADIAAVEGADFSTTNLLSYSESFDVGWTTFQIYDVAENVIAAPDGSMTADKIIPSTLNSVHTIYKTGLPSGVNSGVIYAKAAEYDTLRVYISGSVSNGAAFDLTNETASGLGDGSGTITAVGDGWYRLTVTSPTAGTIFYVYPNNASGYVGNNSDGIYLWGASLTATEYPVEYTTTRNLLTDSQDFERGTWVRGGGGTGTAPVVTQNAGIAPDGTRTAERVQLALNGGTTSADTSNLYRTPGWTVTGISYTASVWIKSYDGTSYDVAIDFNGVNTNVVTVTSTWQRFYATITSLDTVTRAFSAVRLRGSYATSDSADILLWGAQLEPGTVATDYVRTVDTVGKAYRWYEPTEGTVFVEADSQYQMTSGRLAQFDNGTESYRFRIAFEAPTSLTNAAMVNSSLQYLNSFTLEREFKISSSFTHNSANTSHKGVLSSADTSVSVPNFSIFRLNTDSSGTLTFNGHIQRLTYWPTRQPDSTLQVITQ